jgi:hypothetical protein
MDEEDLEWPSLCAAGSCVTPGMLAQIATMLEQHGRIKVYAVATPMNGPGVAAMLFGNLLPSNFFSAKQSKRRTGFVSHVPFKKVRP